MSDLEKDLEQLDDMDIDSDGFGDLSEFVDLDDLSELSAEDVLADMEELGDISDLGDLSDVSELAALDDDMFMPEEDELQPLESEVDASDLLAGLMTDSEETFAEMESDVSSENPVADMIPKEDTNSFEMDDASLDAMEVSEPELDVADLFQAAEPELDAEDLFQTAEPELDVADLFQEAEPEPLEENDFSMGDIPLPDDMDFSADVMDDLEEAASLMENDSAIEEESLDDMLDGLLDDLDANGSLDVDASEPVEMGNEETVEAIQEEAAQEEGGLDDLLSLLTAGGEEVQEEAQEDVIGLDEMFTEEATENLIPEAEEKKPEKAGLLKRLFGNVVTDEIAEKELADREAEKAAMEQKAEEDAKAKEEAEAVKALKAEEKAAKKAAKAEEKALKKTAKAEEKAAKKAEKEARKAQEEAEAELEVVGKLNKVGVSIIVVLTALFLTAEISGTKLFSYHSTLNQAKDYFDMQRYTQAYQEILGTDIKEKDQETYDKIVTVMKVQRSLNSYANYESMKYYPDALNALLRGMEKYDENIELARNLEVEKDMDSCREQILAILQEEYGLSESEAYDILAMEKEEYTEKVVEIGMNSK